MHSTRKLKLIFFFFCCSTRNFFCTTIRPHNIHLRVQKILPKMLTVECNKMQPLPHTAYCLHKTSYNFISGLSTLCFKYSKHFRMVYAFPYGLCNVMEGHQCVHISGIFSIKVYGLAKLLAIFILFIFENKLCNRKRESLIMDVRTLNLLGRWENIFVAHILAMLWIFHFRCTLNGKIAYRHNCVCLVCEDLKRTRKKVQFQIERYRDCL